MGAEKVEVIRKRNYKKDADLQAIRESVKVVLEEILKLLLAHPHSVEYTVGENTTAYLIDIKQEDFGRLVGSNGKTIGGIRVVTTALSATHGIRTIVGIKDEERFL
jgi:predicted RNA-binding protein YlqC (UPF0109 family)